MHALLVIDMLNAYDHQDNYEHLARASLEMMERNMHAEITTGG